LKVRILNLNFVESTNVNTKSTTLKKFELNFWFKRFWTSPTPFQYPLLHAHLSISLMRREMLAIILWAFLFKTKKEEHISNCQRLNWEWQLSYVLKFCFLGSLLVVWQSRLVIRIIFYLIICRCWATLCHGKEYIIEIFY
jgi:hypothetical protein